MPVVRRPLVLSHDDFERVPLKLVLERCVQRHNLTVDSNGSTPPQDHAARLIEVSGLKGFRIGDASVSEKHANFIINHGQAKAADIEALIAHVQSTVEKLHGVRLNPEVRIVGKP